MKIHLFIFLAIIAITKQSIILKEKKNRIIPESNKLQINFGPSEAPVEISTNHRISSIKSTSNILIDPLSKNTHYESPRQKDNLYGNSNAIFSTKIMNVNYESSNPSINEFHHINKTNHIPNINEEENIHINKKHHPKIEKDCTVEDCTTHKKLNQAYLQLGDLKNELETALHEDDTHEPVLMSGNTLKTVVSYLKHLDYINKQEHGNIIGKVPEMPVYKDYEPDYEIDHEKVKEKFENEKLLKNEYKTKIQERRKHLEKAVEELDKDLENLKGQKNQDTEKLDLETEKQKLLEEIETIDNETFDIEKRIEVEAEIERVKKIEEQEIENQKIKDAEALEKEKKKLEGEEEVINEEIEQEGNIIDIEARIDTITKDEEQLSDDPEIKKILEKEKEELQTKLDALKALENVETVKPEEKKEETGLEDELTKEEKEEINKEDFGLDNLGNTENIEEDATVLTDFNDIPGWLRINKEILKGYNAMFEYIPDSTRSLPKNASSELSKGILLYNNLRKFIVSIKINSQHLKNDISYLENKINSIELSHEEIMYFFALGDNYNEININADRKNRNFIKKLGEIKLVTNSFIVEIKKIIHSISQLQEFNDLIIKEVEFIKDDMESEFESDLTAEIKIKKTLEIIPKLIELKSRLHENLDQIDTSLNHVYSFRSEASEIIDDMDLINQGKYFNKDDQIDPLSEGYGINWSFVGIFFTILLL